MADQDIQEDMGCLRAAWGQTRRAAPFFVRHFWDAGQLGRFSGHILKFMEEKTTSGELSLRAA